MKADEAYSVLRYQLAPMMRATGGDHYALAIDAVCEAFITLWEEKDKVTRKQKAGVAKHKRRKRT